MIDGVDLVCEHVFVSYVELHCHSAFSFLDGASLPEELVVAALERGHRALALTDHNSVSGSMEFAQAATSLGLRAIHGAEVDLVDPGTAHAQREGAVLGDAEQAARWTRHVTLLVRDARGWRNLCRLLTRAHARTRETPGRRRVLAPMLTVADLAAHTDGLVCLSGCADRGVHDEPTARALLAAFGRDAFRIELQRPFHRDDRARNRDLAELAGRLGVPCVATGNVHAHEPARARLQDVFVAVREHTTLDASEPLRRGNHTHVLTTPAAMAARFEGHPEAVAETERLAATLVFDLTADLGYRYPGAGEDGTDRTLAEVCAASFDTRYPAGSVLRPTATARLDQELALIRDLGLSGFFLLHHEMLELARDVAREVRGNAAARSLLPPGRGRGSSVSSIVCYLTGLSHVDPIANDLHLGRFLNEEITSLPDIDLDFPRDVRAVLIPRVHEHFGQEKAALVAAFPTYRARGAIRELGKALGLPPGEIERVARSSEAFSAQTVDKDIAVALGKGRQAEGRWRWLAELAAEAHGLPRHLSQHSGGMIVATRPLIDCCPVVPAAMEGRQMVMWDKDSCGDAGFLKIDLLGLGMLSAVERCVEMIALRRDERVDLSRIAMDDKATFDCIKSADTTGVFQIESRAQMGSLRRTRPGTLEELTIQVAIVRPGPIVGGAVNPYIERLQRLRVDPDFEVPYDHHSLEPVLKDTLGTIIFQDQVIEVAAAFAKLSPGEAEGLRKAMSRKRSAAAIEAYHERFVQQAMQAWPDVDEQLAERVWHMVKGFSGFGFPKAHGAAFGLLAYQSTYLRVHYGPEFLASLLDEQPMGFYPPDALVHEAQRRGIAVLAPDVNHSAVGCTVVDVDGAAAVRIGLAYVMGVQADDVEALVAEREAAGPFRTVEELASRAGVARPALEQLAWSGACDALAGGSRRRALWELGVAAPGKRLLTSVTVPSGRRTRADLGTQLALPLSVGEAPALPGLTGWEAMIADYSTTGLTTAEHPLGLLRAELRAKGMVANGDLKRLGHGTAVRLGGLVVARQRPGTAKGVCFLLLEDETGTINLIVPPKVYERDRVVVRAEPLVVAEGVLERHASAGGAINVVCRRLVRLDASGHLQARPAADVVELVREEAQRAAVGEGEELAATGTGDFRAVAPAAQSFASGRRR
ncbi:DNA polymerase III subunit alpha [Baekduia sp.]|uniref:DNA polymerase III subunit alpha n=1 Tax=Baekduia sp. TaxID=2600305 RepID=UPI002E08DDC3|nr:DNA polymerase III subunit alpha [Baekduia sp.]